MNLLVFCLVLMDKLCKLWFYLIIIFLSIKNLNLTNILFKTRIVKIKIQDWKKTRVRKLSCSLKNLLTYFTWTCNKTIFFGNFLPKRLTVIIVNINDNKSQFYTRGNFCLGYIYFIFLYCKFYIVKKRSVNNKTIQKLILND